LPYDVQKEASMTAPTVRRRRLGAELRRLREAVGLKLEDVESRAGITSSTLSRIETARTGVKVADAEILLDLYAVEDVAKRAVMLGLVRDGAKRGWWQTYRDAIRPAYADLISLEADASSLRTYQTTLIPGLLQTAGYARATISAINMTSTPEQVNALVEVRRARQAVLTKPDPLEVWAIIHEASLRTRLADIPTMRDQLQRLLEVADFPHVSLQVLPLEASPHPGLSGPFAVLGFAEGAELDVVLLESLTTALYVEDPAEVTVYGSAFERLRAAALPFGESADLISNLKDNLK
jgi:transcriptional regulator with XRE-family HTH domain